MNEERKKKRKNTCTYGLYRDGTCVMQGSARELGEKLGVNRQAVAQAYRCECKCKEYTVVLESRADGERKAVYGIPEELWQEWDEVCRKIRRAFAQIRRKERG